MSTFCTNITKTYDSLNFRDDELDHEISELEFFDVKQHKTSVKVFFRKNILGNLFLDQYENSLKLIESDEWRSIFVKFEKLKIDKNFNSEKIIKIVFKIFKQFGEIESCFIFYDHVIITFKHRETINKHLQHNLFQNLNSTKKFANPKLIEPVIFDYRLQTFNNSTTIDNGQIYFSFWIKNMFVEKNEQEIWKLFDVWKQKFSFGHVERIEFNLEQDIFLFHYKTQLECNAVFNFFKSFKKLICGILN